MVAAWIGPVLSDKARADLANQMNAILPGSPEQQRQFLYLAEKEVEIYRKLAAPLQRDLDLLPDKLKRVADSGNAFAAALDALGRDSRRILHQLLFVEMGGNHIPEYEQIANSAKCARLLAKAAERHLHEPHQKPPGPLPGGDRAVMSLVNNLACHYARIFQKQPSAARDGIFARALAQILDACDVRSPEDKMQPLKIGESRLRSILQAHAPTK